MSNKTYKMTISGMPINVVRKEIKNINIRVYPPNGHVRVAVPLSISDEAARLAVNKKLNWIKRQKAKIEAQPHQDPLRMVSGETHYFLAYPYRLRVIEHDRPNEVVLRDESLDLYVRPNTSTERRERLLQEWHREQLKLLIPPIIEKWEPILDVEILEWRIKRMRTRWGSCNIQAQRIWLNLELAKKSEQCLEYVIVHEMMHLLERYHNRRFKGLMDKYLPKWRLYRDELNAAQSVS